MSDVSIVKTKSSSQCDIEHAVREAVKLAGGLEDIVKPGYKVMIKPNLVAVPKSRLTGAVTRWEVCKAAADIVAELGGEAFIAETSAAGVDTEKVIEACEYNRLRDMGYKVIDLKPTEKVKIHINKGKVIEEMDTYKLVAETDVIITVPVMKTHDQTEITLGIKNLKGLVNDEQKKQLHRLGVLEGVVDILEAVKPKFSIIDGTVGQEGFGPIFGDPVEMNLIVASRDIAACDAVGGLIMGYEPQEVLITKYAHERGFGEMDLASIEVKGESIESVKRRFKRACEVEIDGLPPFRLLFDEGTCTGCRNTVLSVIMDMKSQNIQHFLEGKVIVAGPLSEIPEGVKKEDLILIGKCTSHLKESGTFVPGCPPNNIFVLKGIVGDRQEVGRRY